MSPRDATFKLAWFLFIKKVEIVFLWECDKVEQHVKSPTLLAAN